MDDEQFGLVIIGGDSLDLSDPLVDRVRFHGLTRRELRELLRLAFREDHAVTIWIEEGGKK